MADQQAPDLTRSQGAPLSPEAGKAIGVDPYAGILQRMQQDQATTQRIRQQQATEAAPIQGQIKAATDSLQQAASAGPQQAQMPEMPKMQPQEMSGTFMALMALAALSGKTTQTPLTTSLNAMTGMMQGMHDGKQEQYEQQYKIWDAETKKALARNKEYVEEYRRIIDSKKLSIQQMHDELDMLAVKYDDQLTRETLSKGDMSSLIKIADARQKAGQHAEAEKAKQDRFWASYNQRKDFHNQNKSSWLARAGVTEEAKARDEARKAQSYEQLLKDEKLELAAAPDEKAKAAIRARYAAARTGQSSPAAPSLSEGLPPQFVIDEEE